MNTLKRNFSYLLPNMLTATSIYLGILSIIYASKSRFELSLWLLVIAMICDMLDGYIARSTNTASNFGKEFDSLSDLISFGVAPSMSLFFVVGYQYGKIGVGVSVLFVLFSAIRLARFNVTCNQQKTFFIGLPTPAAALFIISNLLFCQEYDIDISGFLGYVVLFFVFLVSILLVSNIRYPSIKKYRLREFNKSIYFIAPFIFATLIYIYPEEIVSFFCILYVVFGIGRAIYIIIKRKS